MRRKLSGRRGDIIESSSLCKLETAVAAQRQNSFHKRMQAKNEKQGQYDGCMYVCSMMSIQIQATVEYVYTYIYIHYVCVNNPSSAKSFRFASGMFSVIRPWARLGEGSLCNLWALASSSLQALQVGFLRSTAV